MRKIKKAEEAVSEVIGTIMLLGMAIALFSVLCAVVLTYPFEPAAPSVNLVGMIDGDDILLEHHGGEALSLKTKIILIIGDIRENITAEDKDYLDDKSKADGFWGIGEKLNYPPVANVTGRQIEVMVIDVDSNSLVMSGIIQEEFN